MMDLIVGFFGISLIIVAFALVAWGIRETYLLVERIVRIVFKRPNR